jgi:transcriptional regulator with XRE-family HTH domain
MNLPSGIAIGSTSAGGAMIQVSTGNRVLVGVLAAGLGTSAGYALAAESPYSPPYAIHQSTTSGTVLVPEGGAGAAIGELRRLSGFTWDQLARLFGVSRRSLHFWASGKAMTPANEEHLHRVLATIRKIDRGTATANRAALLSSKDGELPLDLLAEGQYDRVVVVVGAGGASERPALKPLSQAARDARRPRPPEELVEALQDSVHRESGRTRAARSVKVRGAG